MKSYHTPNYDGALEALGWRKFEDHPIYVRHIPHRDRYEICFNQDFAGMQQVYEDFVAQGLITVDQLSTMLVQGFEATCCKTITPNLSYELLIMLTADFYHHNLDPVKHAFYKKYYEELSGKKY